MPNAKFYASDDVSGTSLLKHPSCQKKLNFAATNCDTIDIMLSNIIYTKITVTVSSSRTGAHRTSTRAPHCEVSKSFMSTVPAIASSTQWVLPTYIRMPGCMQRISNQNLPVPHQQRLGSIYYHARISLGMQRNLLMATTCARKSEKFHNYRKAPSWYISYSYFIPEIFLEALFMS